MIRYIHACLLNEIEILVKHTLVYAYINNKQFSRLGLYSSSTAQKHNI